MVMRVPLLRSLKQAVKEANATVSFFAKSHTGLDNTSQEFLNAHGYPGVVKIPLGFHKRGVNTSSQGVIPISESCFKTNVLPALKHINGHVSHRPLDFLYPSRSRGVQTPIPLPKIVPALFHGVMNVIKRVVSTVQKVDLQGNAEVTARQVCFSQCFCIL